MNFDLDEILDRNGSDKQRANGYAPVYHALFKHLRDRDLILLEIGIGTLTPGANSSMHGHDLPGYRPGASLRAWRDYFPNARIHGIDVQADTQLRGEERIVTTLCDSTDAEASRGYLSQVEGLFDIIIDDGAHDPDSQLKTLRNFYPSLRSGGTYVIEDVEPKGSWIQGVTHRKIFEDVIGNALYFTVSRIKADLVVISKRVP